ncbi:BTAD domain-containing putative transcriptional regulator [Kineococcus gynurae]|uniref:BTAD domain-containing putative transcriptional regulator n=1 Tax=Kineococcus gynurae TaxID=452979 RepID=A0ABV5LX29_9ACTN
MHEAPTTVLADPGTTAPSSLPRVEIRLLSPFQVRRADGSRVAEREWRTSKTLDLVRWLAVRAGNPLPVEDALDQLWSASDPAHARASLRTALSHVRRILGPDAVERRRTGLVLNGAWVDTLAFTTLAQEVDRRARAGQDAAALATAREALALYLQPLRAVDDEADWVRDEREDLESTRREVQLSAAEAALRLGLMVDAVQLARPASTADPLSERASRALAAGLAGLGEVDAALRELDRCRRDVAESTGADLSSQTRALHLHLLTGPAHDGGPQTPETTFVGRSEDVDVVRAALAPPSADGADPRAARVVVLRGQEGSGRRRLLAEAAGSRPLVTLVPGALAAQLSALAPGAVAVLETRPGAGPADLRQALVGEARLVVVAGPEDPEPLLPPTGPVEVVRVEVEPLIAEDVVRLASLVLAGAPGAALVTELRAAACDLAGRVVRTLRQWLGEHRVVATSAGLACAPEAGEAAAGSAVLPGHLLSVLTEGQWEVLQLAALVDRPVTVAWLGPLTHLLTPAQAADALAALVEHRILRHDPEGCRFRDPQLKDAVACWLRPVVRSSLERRIVERAHLDPDQRIDLWLRVGEPRMACAAAMEAAAAATVVADWGEARSALLKVGILGDLASAAPADLAELQERLGDVCLLLRRRDEAERALRAALRIVTEHGLPGSERLQAKIAGVTEPPGGPDVLRLFTGPAALLPTIPARRLPDRSELSGQHPRTSARQLGAIVRAADAHGDTALSVDASLELCLLVHLPARDFAAARRATFEVMTRSADPNVRHRAIFYDLMPDMLLGNALRAEHTVREVLEEAVGRDAELVRNRFLGFQLLIAHDLGRPEAADLLDEAEAGVRSGLAAAPGWSGSEGQVEICARVAMERGELDRAAALLNDHPLSPATMPATRQMRQVLAAGLLRVEGRSGEAAALLRQELLAARAAGVRFFVPELVMKLVLLCVDRDRAEALNLFDQWDEVLDDGATMPREQVLRMLARAAVRQAGGDPRRAATARRAAEAAAGVAQLHHLPGAIWNGPPR